MRAFKTCYWSMYFFLPSTQNRFGKGKKKKWVLSGLCSISSPPESYLVHSYQNNLCDFIFKCCSYPYDEFGQGNQICVPFKPRLLCPHLSMQYWRFGGGERRNPSHLNLEDNPAQPKLKPHFSHISPRCFLPLLSSPSLQVCGFIPWQKKKALEQDDH